MEKFDDILKFVPKIADHLANWHLNGIIRHQGEISRVLDLLADEESRDLLLREMAFWAFSGFLKPGMPQAYYGGMNQEIFESYILSVKTQNFKPHIKYPPHDTWVEAYTKATTFLIEQYRYKNIVEVESGEVCLDIGACVGDTSIWMIENGAQDVYAFEIDKTNLEYLRENLAYSADYENVKVFEYGVSDTAKQLYYIPHPNNVGGGRLLASPPTEASGYAVDCIDIDSFCARYHIRPGFIKMDIEGGEPAALAGAKNIIQKYHPKLAICVYHAWQHRWDIPLMLASMTDGYEYYLKKSAPVAETVLFAKPK